MKTEAKTSGIRVKQGQEPQEVEKGEWGPFSRAFKAAAAPSEGLPTWEANTLAWQAQPQEPRQLS